MTVLDNTPRDQYTATGGQVAFSYTFEIAAEGDIAVLQNGVLLSLGTDAGEYAVTGVGSDTGGVVTLVTGATAGDIITLYRDMALERLTSYTNGGDFLAADVNNDYDRLWLALQQNTGTSNRALVAPNTDPTNINMTIPDKATRLGKYLKFNDTTGNPEVGSIAGAFTAAGMNHYNFTGDGATVNFTLGMEPGGENNTQVYIDGVYQQKDGYNVSGSIVQFSVAPPNLSTIEVMVIEVLPVGATTASQVSFTQAGSTYARNVQLKLQESVSVMDFGAVGDGVTDDSAAFQSAQASTTRLVLEAGATYKINSDVNFNGDITIDGNDATILVDGNNGIFDFEGAATNVIVRNLNFVNQTTYTVETELPEHIRCFTANTFLVDNCTFTGSNIELRGTSKTTKAEYIKVRDCTFNATFTVSSWGFDKLNHLSLRNAEYVEVSTCNITSTKANRVMKLDGEIDDISLVNNTITSSQLSGKQVIDLFHGFQKVIFTDNNITATGNFSNVLEAKVSDDTPPAYNQLGDTMCIRNNNIVCTPTVTMSSIIRLAGTFDLYDGATYIGKSYPIASKFVNNTIDVVPANSTHFPMVSIYGFDKIIVSGNSLAFSATTPDENSRALELANAHSIQVSQNLIECGGIYIGKGSIAGGTYEYGTKSVDVLNVFENVSLNLCSFSFVRLAYAATYNVDDISSVKIVGNHINFADSATYTNSDPRYINFLSGDLAQIDVLTAALNTQNGTALTLAFRTDSPATITTTINVNNSW